MDGRGKAVQCRNGDRVRCLYRRRRWEAARGRGGEAEVAGVRVKGVWEGPGGRGRDEIREGEGASVWHRRERQERRPAMVGPGDLGVGGRGRRRKDRGAGGVGVNRAGGAEGGPRRGVLWTQQGGGGGVCVGGGVKEAEGQEGGGGQRGGATTGLSGYTLPSAPPPLRRFPRRKEAQGARRLDVPRGRGRRKKRPPRLQPQRACGGYSHKWKNGPCETSAEVVTVCDVS